MMLLRRLPGFPLLLASIAFHGLVAHSQADKTITIRMIDSRTGHMISTDQLLVQIDHQETLHADWTHLAEDGAATMKVPPDATLILVHGKYDNSMSVYVNCDTVRKKLLPVGEELPDKWYSVPDILAHGIVTHNGCGKGKDSTDFTPKPGEFVFFVRKRNWQEEDMR